MDVAWNKPPYSPIPLSKDKVYKLFIAKKNENIKIIIATLEKSIALSRLKVTALDKSKNNKE